MRGRFCFFWGGVGFDDVWTAVEIYDRAEFEVSIVNQGIMVLEAGPSP